MIPENLTNRGITKAVRFAYFRTVRTEKRNAELKKMYEGIWCVINYLKKQEQVELVPALISPQLRLLASRLYYLYERKNYRSDNAITKFLAETFCTNFITVRRWILHHDVQQEPWLIQREPLYKDGKPLNFRAEDYGLAGLPMVLDVEPVDILLTPKEEKRYGNKEDASRKRP